MEALDTELSKIVAYFKTELSHLQMGRASVALIDHVEIEVYGAKQPIKNIANISIPDPKSIAIQPWDKANLHAIEKGIMEANLGFSPVNDGNFVRINIPPLSEERRKDLVKMVWKLAEESKISIRNVRQEHMKDIKAKEKDVGEDEVERQEKIIQEKVDKSNKEIEEMAKQKEKDVMTV
jgi:ribosome recycling factor